MKLFILMCVFTNVAAAASLDGIPEAPLSPAIERDYWDRVGLKPECRSDAHKISTALFYYASALSVMPYVGPKTADIDEWSSLRKDGHNLLMKKIDGKYLNVFARDLIIAKADPVKVAKRYLDEIFHVLRVAEDSQSGCFEGLSIGYAFHGLDFDEQFPPSLWLEHKFLFELYTHHHLIPLTQKMRADLLRQSGHENKILGAYVCDTTTIYFDPYHGPVDLDGILRHEQDHLTRDKFLNRFLDPNAPKLTATEYAIADELLASLTGLKEEISHRNLPNLGYDISLYNYHGKLTQLEKSYGVDQFIILGTVEEILHGAFKSWELKKFTEIIKLVADVYVPRAHYRTARIISWLRSVDPKSFGLLESRGKNENFDGEVGGNWTQFLDSPSNRCQQFSEELKTGALKSYLGNRVRIESKGSTKPGSEGVKPGSEGVKPGSEGVKPGSEGVKPGITALRPCVQPASIF